MQFKNVYFSKYNRFGKKIYVTNLCHLIEKLLSFPQLPSMKKIIINSRHSMLAEFSAGLSYAQFNGLYWISKVFRCLFLYEVNSHVALETISCLIRLRTILLGKRREQLHHHSMYNTSGQFTQPVSLPVCSARACQVETES